MVDQGPGTQLVDEAVDVTATEAHVRAVRRISAALAYALRGRAGVLSEIFLRVDNREQVSPDVLVAAGVEPASRTVYAVPPEPVPSVTIEVLSPANSSGQGRSDLAAKRALLGRIGVPLHIEIDTVFAVIAVWELRDGGLTRTGICTEYTSDAIGGVRLETPGPDVLRVLLPDGHDVLGDGGELARAAAEAARADRLVAQLRALGVDPDE